MCARLDGHRRTDQNAYRVFRLWARMHRCIKWLQDENILLIDWNTVLKTYYQLIFIEENFNIRRPHRLHEMRSVAINDPSVSLSVTRTGCSKTAERIGVLIWMETLGRPEKHGGPRPGLYSKVTTARRQGLDAAFAKLLSSCCRYWWQVKIQGGAPQSGYLWNSRDQNGVTGGCRSMLMYFTRGVRVYLFIDRGSIYSDQTRLLTSLAVFRFMQSQCLVLVCGFREAGAVKYMQVHSVSWPDVMKDQGFVVLRPTQPCILPG